MSERGNLWERELKWETGEKKNLSPGSDDAMQCDASEKRKCETLAAWKFFPPNLVDLVVVVSFHFSSAVLQVSPCAVFDRSGLLDRFDHPTCCKAVWTKTGMSRKIESRYEHPHPAIVP